MKIVLVFPPFYLESMYNLPPLGLINLATALKQSLHQVTVLDFVLALRQNTLRMRKEIYDQCAEIIMAQDPDLVGFSAQCTTYPAVLQIARRIKQKRSWVRNVIGGHNAAFVDTATLQGFPFIDAIVRGEGEITFPELVAAYDSGRTPDDVAGITYRCADEIVRNPDRPLVGNLDELPPPDYNMVPSLAEYRRACRLPRSIAILEVGRGCPHHCIYCSESILWRRQSRAYSVSRLVGEMARLHRDFGAECFLLAYDQFTARRKFVESFCRRVIAEKLDHLPWYCISRLDTVDAPLLELMRQAGCESMCYGIDSGSRRTLSFIRKNINQNLLLQRVQETAAQGIIPTLSFVVGFPPEHQEDIDQTLELALKTGIVGNSNPLIQLPTVLPGTELYRRYGRRLLRAVDTYFALGLEFTGGRRLAEDEQMITAQPLIFSSFYNLPCAGLALEDLNLVATYFPLIVRSYPKSFLLLARETASSISLLFLDWLQWLARVSPRRQLSLSPRDCYLHFGSFVSEVVSTPGRLRWRHLPDIVRYETLALKVGQFTSSSNSFYIDINKLREYLPAKSRKIIVAEFDFDLPAIVTDMKAGRYLHRYPSSKSWLVFRQEGGQLEVSEINPFGRDLLELCDGKTPMKQLAARLYVRYGAGVDPEDFLESCAEAVRALGEMQLLDAGEDESVVKGGECCA